MKVAVVGAGAIGAFVGACLARGGAETYLVARGEHLAALRRDGVRVTGPIGDFQVDVPATDDPQQIGPVDYVFLGLKAYSYATASDLLAPLMGPQTAVIAAQNGIPWWYFHGHGGPLDGHRLDSVDPAGAVSATIPVQRAIGCVVYPATELAAPGHVRHIEGTRFSIGEPDRTDSPRARHISQAMNAGGLKCRVSKDLRAEIWVKLLGNATLNPLSALTGATIAQMCAFTPTRTLLAQLMSEVATVAQAIGCPPRISIERRLQAAAEVGHHKTSMLQDLQAGKRLELEVLVQAILEIATLVNLDLPRLQTIHAATALLDQGRR